jgi:hypothetical protein
MIDKFLMTRKLLCCWIVLLIVSSCRERFEAEGNFKNENFLVVEGFINVGEGVTRIKLSRVTGLNEPDELVSETEANVFIEDDDGSVYTLNNLNNGLYESEELHLDANHNYRLRVESNEKVYLSAYTTPVISPRTDSVGWTKGADNYINIHVNTHDPRNSTFYYKWEYEEVWEVRSTYVSKWAYENGVSRVRPADEVRSMTYCWPNARNQDLILASSAQFATDAITLFPLTRFYITDPRLGWRYSVIVKQRALTLEEYEFLQIMKKNSSALGSFFDGQPSQMPGNMYSTSTNETVVGFIGSYTSDLKQLIIKRDEISDFSYTTPCYYEPAEAFLEDPLFQSYLSIYQTLEPIYGPSEDDAQPIIGFSVARRECADCRIFSGTAPKPPFWVEEDEGDVE